MNSLMVNSSDWMWIATWQHWCIATGKRRDEQQQQQLKRWWSDDVFVWSGVDTRARGEDRRTENGVQGLMTYSSQPPMPRWMPRRFNRIAVFRLALRMHARASLRRRRQQRGTRTTDCDRLTGYRTTRALTTIRDAGIARWTTKYNYLLALLLLVYIVISAIKWNL